MPLEATVGLPTTGTMKGAIQVFRSSFFLENAISYIIPFAQNGVGTTLSFIAFTDMICTDFDLLEGDVVDVLLYNNTNAGFDCKGTSNSFSGAIYAYFSGYLFAP